jgi:hypothetical protein
MSVNGARIPFSTRRRQWLTPAGLLAAHLDLAGISIAGQLAPGA